MAVVSPHFKGSMPPHLPMPTGAHAKPLNMDPLASSLKTQITSDWPRYYALLAVTSGNIAVDWYVDTVVVSQQDDLGEGDYTDGPDYKFTFIPNNKFQFVWGCGQAS